MQGAQHPMVYMREWSEEEPEGDKLRGRQSIVQLAQRLQRTREPMNMTVIHANAGGVLVEGKYFKGTDHTVYNLDAAAAAAAA